MDPVDFLKGRTRETQISRDAGGRWWNAGDPIEHPALVRAFDGWIDRAEDGRFCLSNDINWAYVDIQGPPYFVRAVDVDDDGIVLLLSGDRAEPLDPSTLRQDAEGALYCDVREGRCPARFDNHATNQLADRIGEDADGVYVEVGGERVRPPVMNDPMAWPRPGGATDAEGA